jgi:hypothetical protein
MSEETNQTAETNISITDIANAYAIIDLAAKRGAFQATELQAVGTVVNKLKSFLDGVQAARQANAAAQNEAAPTEGTVE